MIKLQKRKDELKIKLPKSLRKLMIGIDKISEDFGLNASNKSQVWIRLKPKVNQKGENLEN